jgi:hypothetical protein
MRTCRRFFRRLIVVLWAGGAVVGIAGSMGGAAASAQDRLAARGRVLFGGVVRPDLPAAVLAPAGATWRGEWGTSEVEVTGNAATFVWPERGAPLLRGNGAPPPGSFHPLPSSMAVVGVSAGADSILDGGSPSGPADGLREAILRALKRPARFVLLERELDRLPPPALSALDLLVARDRSELLGRPAIESWIRLGGHAIVIRATPEQVGRVGFGQVHGPDSRGGWGSLELPAAYAGIRPPRPTVPEPPDPQRAWPLLAVLAYVFLVWWAGRPGSRRLGVRLGTAGLIGLVGVAICFGPLPDTWATQASRSIWCLPGNGAQPWRHVCYRISSRGGAPASLATVGTGPVLFTRLPGHARLRAMVGRTRVTWAGDGWLSMLETRPPGPGIRVRRAGAKTLLAARLPAGQALDPAYWIGPGEVRALPRLESGTVCHVEEARPVGRARLLESLGDLMAAFPAPPMSGVVLGVLRGAELEGENLVYALPERVER